MTDWKQTRLKDSNIQIIDGDRSSNYPKRDEFCDEGVLFLNTKNIVDNRLNLSEVNFISDGKFSKIKKGRLRKNDIIMTTRGSIGKVALFNSKYQTGLINAQMLILRADGQNIDPNFMFYLLSSDNVQGEIRGFASGSAQPQIPIQDLKEISIVYPPIEYQRKVAYILSAYDNLIKNNTRRIQILEQMAQMLYREWFVDFRFPGYEAIPTKTSSLGPIPDGWDLKPVTEAVLFNPSTRVPRDGSKPFVPMNCLSDDSMIIMSSETRTGNSGAKFMNEDTLFARITPCLENGKTGYVQFLDNPQSVAFGSTEFIVMRSKTLTPEYVYLLARSSEFRNHAIKSMSGATGRQRVQESSFQQFPLAHPDALTLQKFSHMTKPMFASIFNLAKQNGVLRQTRNLLLPKLMSGEIDVSELDIATGEIN